MSHIRKYLYWATIGLFVYMPFHIFFSQWLSTFTGGLDTWKIAKDIFTTILVSAIVCAVLLQKKYTRTYLLFVGFACIYLILHLASWFLTEQPNDTGLLATVYNNRIVWYLLIGYSIALLFPDKNSRKFFAKLLIIISTIVCLIGLAQWLLPKDIMTHFGYSLDRGVKPNFFIDDKPDFPRIMSTIRDPNSLGAFLLLPTTLITIGLVRFWKTPKRVLLAGLFLLHLLAIFLTFSRGAWISILLVQVATFIFIFRDSIHRYSKKLALPLIATLIVVSAVGFGMRESYFVQNVILHSDETTVAADPNELRVEFFEKSIQGIEANPEGNGPGTAGLVSTRLPNGGLLTENYYLQIAYEVGIAGLLMLLGFVAYILKLLWSRRQSLVVQGLLISFIGLAFMNLLIHGWSNEAVAASWFILAGLSLTEQTQGSRVALKHTTKPQPQK